MKVLAWLGVLLLSSAIVPYDSRATPMMAAQALPAAIDTGTVIEDTHHKALIEKEAARWGLSVEDWVIYQEAMQGIAGHLYKDMLPIEVLALITEDTAQRDRYVDMAIDQLQQHVARVLAYERDMKQRFWEKYPDLPIINNVDVRPFSPLYKKPVVLNANSRLLLFTTTQNPANWAIVPTVLALLQTQAGVGLDIYLVSDSKNALALQTWALRHQIPMEAVNNNTITLNHDNGHLLRKMTGLDDLPTLLLFDGSKTRILSVYDM